MKGHWMRVVGVAAVVACAGSIGSAATAAPADPPRAAAAGPFLQWAPPPTYGMPPQNAPEGKDLTAERVSREEATDALLPDAVAYYARTYDVSTSTARYRLATQGMVPSAGAVLKELLGDGYTDHWWDQRTGELVVMVTGAVPADEVAEVLTERGLVAADFRVEHVEYNQRELLDAGEQLTAELAERYSGDVATVGIGAGRVRVEFAADAAASSRSQAAAIAERVVGGEPGTPPVDVVRSDRSNLAGMPAVGCNQTGAFPNTARYCDTIIGGSSYTLPSPTPGWNTGCTWAFWTSWRSRGTFIPSMLTAGHCLNAMPTVTPISTCRAPGVGCGQVGLSLQYFFGYGRSDWGMIDMYAAGWLFYGGWWNWSVGYATPIAGLEWTPPGAGYVLCKNGATSGSSCGTVDLSVSSPGNYPEPNAPGVGFLSNEIRVRGLQSCHGDSGAPVTGASVANGVGVLSLMTVANPGDLCTDLATGSQWIAPIWEPITYFDLAYYGGGPYGPYA